MYKSTGKWSKRVLVQADERVSLGWGTRNRNARTPKKAGWNGGRENGISEKP